MTAMGDAKLDVDYLNFTNEDLKNRYKKDPLAEFFALKLFSRLHSLFPYQYKTANDRISIISFLVKELVDLYADHLSYWGKSRDSIKSMVNKIVISACNEMKKFPSNTNKKHFSLVLQTTFVNEFLTLRDKLTGRDEAKKYIAPDSPLVAVYKGVIQGYAPEAFQEPGIKKSHAP